MMWVFAILIVLALGGVGFVAAGRGAPLDEQTDDRADVLVPADRALGADDLRRVRFPVTLRGYRMADVDALLARLAEEADQRAAQPGVAPEVAQALTEQAQHTVEYEAQQEAQEPSES